MPRFRGPGVSRAGRVAGRCALPAEAHSGAARCGAARVPPVGAVADEGCGRGAGVIHSRIVLRRVVRGDGRAAGRRRRVEGGAAAASRRFIARGVVPASSAGILGEALFRFMTPERSDRFKTIGSVPILFPMPQCCC